VGGEQDGLAALAQVEDGIPQAAAALGIEAGGRLVEEDEARIVDEGEGEGEALALAAGEVLWVGVGLFFERDLAQQVVGGEGAGIEGAVEGEQFTVGQLAKERGGLKLDADTLLDSAALAADVEPLGPSRPKISPGRTSKLTPLTAVKRP
jgi:hypothetical protein